MGVEFRRLPVAALEQNTGQIEGVPGNPRQWTRAELDRLKKSIAETPELFEARGCVVAPIGGAFVVLGGNMRLAAAKELGEREVPCMVLPEGLPASKLREIVIKDNGAFGAWDFDALANEWDDLPLKEWGVGLNWADDSINAAPEEFGEEFSLPDGNKSPFQQMTFTFSEFQADFVNKILGEIKRTKEFNSVETFGNKNANGNALYLILKQWDEQRK